MLDIKGDLWRYPGDWICVPTNGMVTESNNAIMGGGVAYAATKKLSGVERTLGSKLLERGNHVHYLGTMDSEQLMFSFPTKEDFKDPSTLDLVQQSAVELKKLWEKVVKRTGQKPVVLLPRVGCGLGGLEWKDIKPILETELQEDQFVVLDNS